MSLIRCIIRFNPSFSSFKILTKFTLNANSLNPPAASKQISNQVSRNKVSSNSRDVKDMKNKVKMVKKGWSFEMRNLFLKIPQTLKFRK